MDVLLEFCMPGVPESKKEGAHWATSGSLLSLSPLNSRKHKARSPRSTKPSVNTVFHLWSGSFPPGFSEATLRHLEISNNHLGGRETKEQESGGIQTKQRGAEVQTDSDRGDTTKGFVGGNRGSPHHPRDVHQLGVSISHRLTERWKTLWGLHTPEFLFF